MKDLKFDTEAMEEMIKAMSVAEDSSESSSSTTEPKVSIDLDFTFKVNYSGWNTVDDKDVTPSQTIIDSATKNVSSSTSSDSSTTPIGSTSAGDSTTSSDLTRLASSSSIERPLS